MMSFFNPEQFLPLVLSMLVALTFHEFAHAWVAYKLGDDTAYREGRVTLNPIVHLDLWGSLCFLASQGIGWAKPVPVNPTNLGHPRRDDILVTAAGPFSNLLLGLLSGVIFFTLIYKQILPYPSEQTTPIIRLTYYFLHKMVVINFMLMIFNLIPLYPLDGSHIVTNLLPLNQAYRFKRFNENYGASILISLFVLGYISQGRIAPFQWIIVPPMELLVRGLQSLVVWLL